MNKFFKKFGKFLFFLWLGIIKMGNLRNVGILKHEGNLNFLETISIFKKRSLEKKEIKKKI